MSRIVRFQADAQTEAHDTVHWYEQERVGLGRELMAEIETILDRMRAMPERYPLIGPSTRRAVLVRFPFVMLYVIESGEVLVTGIFHSHRDPRSWADRVREVA